MTDRLNALTVALEEDIREDDAQRIVDAIKCLRGVLTVEGNVVDSNYWIAEQRVRHHLHGRLWEVLRGD